VVIDAMIKAYQDALDKDVKEQLITTAQSKGLRVQLAEQVTSLVNQAGQPVLMQMLTLPGFGTGAAFPPDAPPYLAGATGANPSAAGPLPPAHVPGAVMTGTAVSTPSGATPSTPAPTASAP